MQRQDVEGFQISSWDSLLYMQRLHVQSKNIHVRLQLLNAKSGRQNTKQNLHIFFIFIFHKQRCVPALNV